MKIKQQPAYLYAALAILFWSTVASAFKLTLRHLTPLGLLFFSSCFAFIFLAAYRLISKGNSAFADPLSNLKKSLLAGLINPFVYYLMLFYAYDRLPAQQAQVLNYTWAIMLPIFSMIFFKEKFRKLDFLALALSFFGVILIASKGRLADMKIDDPVGVTIAISTSVIWAFYWILNLKDQREASQKLTYNFLVGSVLIFIYSMVMMASGVQGWFVSSGKIALGIVGAFYVGIFEMGLTFLIWNNALKTARNTAIVSNLIFITPFVSLLFIYLILGEPIHWATVAGLLIILSSNWLQNR
jgi:drug/metabolite transporter (DMT)-like permease